MTSAIAIKRVSMISFVLRLDRIDDVRNCDAQLREFVRLHPEPHCILSGSENLRLAYAIQAGDRIVEVDVRVVAKELCIEGALRGKQANQHERSGYRLSDSDPVGANFGRKLAGRQLLARLREDEIGIGVRLQVEVHDHGGL